MDGELLDKHSLIHLTCCWIWPSTKEMARVGELSDSYNTLQQKSHKHNQLVS